MHDLARFILHFYFFLGVTVFQERIDMWQQVEGDRVRKNCQASASAVADARRVAPVALAKADVCRVNSSTPRLPLPETA